MVDVISYPFSAGRSGEDLLDIWQMCLFFLLSFNYLLWGRFRCIANVNMFSRKVVAFIFFDITVILWVAFVCKDVDL